MVTSSSWQTKPFSISHSLERDKVPMHPFHTNVVGAFSSKLIPFQIERMNNKITTNEHEQQMNAMNRKRKLKKRFFFVSVGLTKLLKRLKNLCTRFLIKICWHFEQINNKKCSFFITLQFFSACLCLYSERMNLKLNFQVKNWDVVSCYRESIHMWTLWLPFFFVNM